MVDEPEPSTTPAVDEWIDEVGEPGVLEAVVHGDDSWADLDQLTPKERGAVDDLLSA